MSEPTYIKSCKELGHPEPKEEFSISGFIIGAFFITLLAIVAFIGWLFNLRDPIDIPDDD